MVEQTRALVLHDGRGAAPADRMKGWSDMPADARRRRAMAAALAHDTDALWSLADAYLTLKGRVGAGTSEKTRARYREAITHLIADWSTVSMLQPEMLGLRWSDVNMTTKELVITHGKGDKRRTVVLSKGLRAALTAVPREQRGEYVLPYRSRQSGWYRIKKIAQEAGVAERGLHSLRHTAGTRLYGQTHDLLQVAAQLGHAHVETSRTYAKRDRSELHESVGEWV